MKNASVMAEGQIRLSPTDRLVLEALERCSEGIRATDLAIEARRAPGSVGLSLRKLASYGWAARRTYRDRRGAEITNSTFDTEFHWTSVTWTITEQGRHHLDHH